MRRLVPLVALLLGACASAQTTYYTLSPVSPAAQATSGMALKPPIEVGEVSIPPTIDRDEIVIAAPGDRLDLSANAAWGAPIRQLIRRTLSADLTARLPPGSVLPLGDPAPSGGLRIVTLNIQQFGGDASGRVVLQTTWRLSRSGSTSTGPPHSEMIELHAGSGKVPAIVPAMSQALAELASRIAQSVPLR